MEAGTHKKKLNKAKLKKTIKNVLCRPDPLNWPLISEEHKNILDVALLKYKIETPEFKKPHWKELKLLSKDKRPKAPKVMKHDGFIFGISACCNAIKTGQCSGVLIESAVNPRIIVQALLEACTSAKIPVLCMESLRKISQKCFGIATTALGIKINQLIDIENKIIQISKNYIVSQNVTVKDEGGDDKMIERHIKENAVQETDTNISTTCPYLYRTHNETRIFTPSGSTALKRTKDFIGQSYIEFSDKSNEDKQSNGYSKMTLKRVSNNPNRVNIKRKKV